MGQKRKSTTLIPGKIVVLVGNVLLTVYENKRQYQCLSFDWLAGFADVVRNCDCVICGTAHELCGTAHQPHQCSQQPCSLSSSGHFIAQLTDCKQI